MLQPTDHCHNCANSKFNPKTGILCSLTDEKPKFQDKCVDFEADEEGPLKIKKLSKIINDPNLSRQNIIGSTILQVIAGLGILAFTYYLTNLLWDKGWVTSMTLTLGIFGLVVIASSIPLYKRNMGKRNDAVNKLEIIEKVYNKYF
jgi:hypothetical protein